MKAIPYLYFNGQAEEATYFYKSLFDGEITTIMKFKDQPFPGMTKEMGERILHAEVTFDGNTLYLSDGMVTEIIRSGNNVQINLNCDTEEQIHRLYKALKEDGIITMELQDTFWGAVYGAVTDKFKVNWSFNYQKPQS